MRKQRLGQASCSCLALRNTVGRSPTTCRTCMQCGVGCSAQSSRPLAPAHGAHPMPCAGLFLARLALALAQWQGLQIEMKGGCVDAPGAEGSLHSRRRQAVDIILLSVPRCATSVPVSQPRCSTIAAFLSPLLHAAVKRHCGGSTACWGQMLWLALQCRLHCVALCLPRAAAWQNGG